MTCILVKEKSNNEKKTIMSICNATLASSTRLSLLSVHLELTVELLLMLVSCVWAVMTS